MKADMNGNNGTDSATKTPAGRQAFTALQLYFGSIALLVVVSGIVKLSLKLVLG